MEEDVARLLAVSIVGCSEGPLPPAALHSRPAGGNLYASNTFSPRTIIVEDDMGRGMLLWLIGIPLPIILLIWLFGGLS